MLPLDQPLRDEKGFIHEIKWDGFRVLAYLDRGEVLLESRNGHSLNQRFAQLLPELEKVGGTKVFDGEVVAFNQEGEVDFSSLRTHRPLSPIFYIVFDLLFLEGEDLCAKPWFERRQCLDSIVSEDGLVRISPLLPDNLSSALAVAKGHGLEGIISKEKNSPYLPGSRSPLWRKQKFIKTLDCIMVGLKLMDDRIRSMAVALYQSEGTLFYLGNVGSGLSYKELSFLEQSLELLTSDQCPLVNPPVASEEWIWLKPLVVVEIEYLELTPAKRLRHPVFLRFRFDKDPKECTMEVS